MRTQDKYLVTISMGTILTETSEDPQTADACLPTPAIGFAVTSREHQFDITMFCSLVHFSWDVWRVPDERHIVYMKDKTFDTEKFIVASWYILFIIIMSLPQSELFRLILWVDIST